MSSTYSALKIELIGTGDQSGTWGVTTNTNLGTALEEAVVGRANPNFTSDADLTISLTNTNATQTARNYILNVTSSVSLSTTRNLIVPTINKPYIVENNTTGSQSIIVKTSAGSGITVPNGKVVMVYANSTDVVSALTHIPSLTLGTPLPIASGGTGATTLSGANIPTTNSSNTFTAAQTFRAASAVRSEAASTQDAVVLAGRAGGTSSYAVTLTPATLSSSTTLTLPNVNDTLAVLGTAQTFTADQAITGNLTLNAQGDVRFADADSSNWVAFQAPATISSNVTWTLPSADGTNGQVLQTNGSGTLSWSTSSGGISTGKAIAMAMIFGF